MESSGIQSRGLDRTTEGVARFWGQCVSLPSQRCCCVVQLVKFQQIHTNHLDMLLPFSTGNWNMIVIFPRVRATSVIVPKLSVRPIQKMRLVKICPSFFFLVVTAEYAFSKADLELGMWSVGVRAAWCMSRVNSEFLMTAWSYDMSPSDAPRVFLFHLHMNGDRFRISFDAVERKASAVLVINRRPSLWLYSNSLLLLPKLSFNRVASEPVDGDVMKAPEPMTALQHQLNL